VPPLDALPRRIWFYWHQGRDRAPELVQQCHRSWRIRNPAWEVVDLHADNLADHLSLDGGEILRARTQARSDLVRINLLQRHGGLWVDATCFCITPLDDWLGRYAGSGFFAFRNPGADRLLSSWFLAAAPQSYIANTWADAANRYWSGPTPPKRVLGPRFTAHTPRLWLSKPVKEWLRIYPYYWFHYLFRELYGRDPRFRDLWDQVPERAAGEPHAALRKGLHNPIDDSFRREIDQGAVPLYKLNWRAGENATSPDCVLQYLYRTL